MLDISAVVADVALVARDVTPLVLTRALLGILVLQTTFIRSQIRPVAPDVPAVRTNVGLVVRNIALVGCDVMPVGIRISLRGVFGRVGRGRACGRRAAVAAARRCPMLADLVRAAVPPIGTDVAPVCAQVGTITLDVLAVLANVGLVTRDVALLVFPGALLGVLMLQRPLVGTQVRTIALQIPTVRPDVCAVVTDVTAILGQICVTLV